MCDEPGSHNTSTYEPSVHPRGSEQTPHRSATTPQERQQLYNQTVETLQRALDHLNITLENMLDHTNKQRGETIRHKLVHMIDLVDNYNPYDEVNTEEFYRSLSHSVHGTMKWDMVNDRVSTADVKTMFPHYQAFGRVKGYMPTRCTDALVAPFIYPRWLATHHRWPQKDELPLYFCKQLFAEFHLLDDVDYTDFPKHARQGKGRFSDKFKRPGAPPPVNKWALIGPNLVVLPKSAYLAHATDSVPDDTRQSIFSNIATIATQVDEMTSDQVGRCLLRSHTSIHDASASDDPYVRVDIPSSMDVARMHDIDPLRYMSACLSSDLLDAYQVIAMDHGIPLQDAPSFVRRALGRPGASSRGCEHTDSQRTATAHPTALPQHTSIC